VVWASHRRTPKEQYDSTPLTLCSVLTAPNTTCSPATASVPTTARKSHREGLASARHCGGSQAQQHKSEHAGRRHQASLLSSASAVHARRALCCSCRSRSGAGRRSPGLVLAPRHALGVAPRPLGLVHLAARKRGVLCGLQRIHRPVELGLRGARGGGGRGNRRRGWVSRGARGHRRVAPCQGRCALSEHPILNPGAARMRRRMAGKRGQTQARGQDSRW
jgi:hypothetical protein